MIIYSRTIQNNAAYRTRELHSGLNNVVSSACWSEHIWLNVAYTKPRKQWTKILKILSAWYHFNISVWNQKVNVKSVRDEGTQNNEVGNWSKKYLMDSPKLCEQGCIGIFHLLSDKIPFTFTYAKEWNFYKLH